MRLSINTRQSYSEIDEFLSLLSNKQRNKIPRELRNLFRTEKDKEYVKKINPKIPIKDQNLKEETLGIIAFLNLKYWCEDESEKERLRKTYAQNEIKYQEMLQEKFSKDDIFKKRKEKIEVKCEEINNKEITEYKNSSLRKLWNRILEIFKIRT